MFSKDMSKRSVALQRKKGKGNTCAAKEKGGVLSLLITGGRGGGSQEIPV